MAAAAQAETAVAFFSRWGGEAFDVSRADWYLRETEKALLRQLSAAFEKVVVVLNTPSVIDTSWAKDKVDGIRVDSVLYAGYTGMQGGLAIADVLLGRVNPSGKANDTWAKDLTAYPSTAGWDQNNQAYTEDIFVGYRWFETFDPRYETVNYEFGFGLSYTDFTIETKNFSAQNGTVTVDAVVTNTGGTAGKEVVQLYAAAPQGVLGRAANALCDYAKTKTLAPGESQTLTLTDRFGVERYPFGTDATLSLLCAERGDASEEPQVEIRSDKPVTVEIFWDEGRQSKTIAVNGT